MDLLALQATQKNHILDLKVKRMHIRRKIYGIDQEILEKNREIESLLNGTNCSEATVVAPSASTHVDRPDNLKRKWSEEDEGFGSASDCEISASRNRKLLCNEPAASAVVGPSTNATKPAHLTPPPAVDVDSLLANLLSAGVIHKKKKAEDGGFGSAPDRKISATQKPSWTPPAASAVARPPRPTKATERIHSTPAPALNVDSLLANLLSTGVLQKPVAPVATPRAQANPVKPSLRHPKSLRVRNPIAIAALYNSGGNAKHSRDQRCAESMASTQYPSVANWTKC